MTTDPSGLGTRYARNGEVALAYQVIGDGPVDVVVVPGFVSHVELNWEVPFFRRLFTRLARSCRVVIMDKRGTGLSDRHLGVATLEDRVDDVRAVMDAAGVERAALVGLSEGVSMSLLMTAAHPDRVAALVLYAGFARLAAADDYPIGVDPCGIDRWSSYIERAWGSGEVLDVWVSHPPDEDAARRELARFERYSCTPAVAAEIMRRNVEIDVRPALPAIRVPVLVVQCQRDPVIPVAWGRYLADHVPGARYIELDGDFHASWLDSEADAVVDPVEQFITGAPPVHDDEVDRVLATVLFTDIVGSTERAAGMGDRRWRELLDRHDTAMADLVATHRGRVVHTTGDGVLATFDGPARAIRCALRMSERASHLGVEIRAGVHSGECERRGDDLAGIAVHVGARIADRAAPGEVLVSRTVRDLVAGSGLEFVERGRHALKGVPGEWDLLAALA